MRRIACRGPGDRPCPAHAWFYYSGAGRPRERCAARWEIHESARRAENEVNRNWKRAVLLLASVRGNREVA